MSKSLGNMPVLYINIMDGLKTDVGRDAFLWASERPDADAMQYRAEKFAHDVERVASTIAPWIQAGVKQHGLHGDIAHDVEEDILSYIRVRQANLFGKGNSQSASEWGKS